MKRKLPLGIGFDPKNMKLTRKSKQKFHKLAHGKFFGKKWFPYPTD